MEKYQSILVGKAMINEYISKKKDINPHKMFRSLCPKGCSIEIRNAVAAILATGLFRETRNNGWSFEMPTIIDASNKINDVARKFQKKQPVRSLVITSRGKKTYESV